MLIENHLENVRESLRELEAAVKTDLSRKQRTIGFHTSAAAMDMLEIMLHQKRLIDAGFVVKHEWLKSKNKIAEKLYFDFPRKQDIIAIASRIEAVRNPLCYGKRQPVEVLVQVLRDFQELKLIFQEVTGYEL